MRDASYIVALLGVIFLVVAGVAWLRIVRSPAETPPTAKDSKRASFAAMVIVIAFLLSAVAAAIAFLGIF